MVAAGPVAHRPGRGAALTAHHLAAVYAAGFGLSADGVFFNPAAALLLPSMVGEHELVADNSGL